MSTKRVLSAIVDQNIGGLWESLIDQKRNQLNILADERKDLRTEANVLKQNLMSIGATVPTDTTSRDFDKAKNLPIAFVGDELNNMEEMITYSQGQVDSLTKALNEFNQGKALYDEMGHLYASLNAVDDMYGPEGYRDYIVEGNISDTITGVTDPQEGYTEDGQYFHLRGGRPTTKPGSEMAELFANLTPEQQKLMKESPQFMEGFQSKNIKSHALEQQGVNLELENKRLERNLQLLETENVSNQIKNMKKDQIWADMDKYSSILDERGLNLVNGIKTELKLAGTTPRLINMALNAGDTDTFNKHMNTIANNDEYNAIQGDIRTILESFEQGDPETLMMAYSNLSKEFEAMDDIQKNWQSSLTATEYANLVKKARTGSLKGIDTAYHDQMNTYYRSWIRMNQLKGSGLMPNYFDLTEALTLYDTIEDLNDKKLDFFGETSAENVDELYRQGFAKDIESWEERFKGEYTLTTPPDDIDPTIDIANSIWSEINTDPNIITDPDDQTDLLQSLGVDYMTGEELFPGQLPLDMRAMDFKVEYNWDEVEKGITKQEHKQHLKDSVIGAWVVSPQGIEMRVEDARINVNGEVEVKTSINPLFSNLMSLGMAPEEGEWMGTIDEYQITDLGYAPEGMPTAFDAGDGIGYFYDPIRGTYRIKKSLRGI